ncbi:hypothetical protein KC19_11G044900 [Ceratodon purpureus]|uniref:Uncharacterized protein n=1 Tax=Ceratodon purpureus TaxID=3225 RepID=A0A8T0GB92_CERPU|nr:hypothetical protein KC19_11G044900 [Ceratodon purpureus]
MAGLLHRCVPTRCSSPAVVGFPANGSFGRRVVMSVRVAPKWARLSICRASSEGGSAGVRPEEEASQERMVFKDEQNEIICYYDANGDLVCEGWDEGPHFQPDPQQPALRRRRKFTRIVQARGAGEVVDFKNIKERMREQLREVTKESFDSSEL